MVECDNVCKAAQIASVAGLVIIVVILAIIFNM